MMQSLPASPSMLDRIKSEQADDHICKNLIEFCPNGWPKVNTLSDDLYQYYTYKNNISFNDGFLTYNMRLVIPPTRQLEIISRIHEGHFSIVKCRERAKQSVWWMGLSTR